MQQIYIPNESTIRWINSKDNGISSSIILRSWCIYNAILDDRLIEANIHVI